MKRGKQIWKLLKLLDKIEQLAEELGLVSSIAIVRSHLHWQLKGGYYPRGRESGRWKPRRKPRED